MSVKSSSSSVGGGGGANNAAGANSPPPNNNNNASSSTTTASKGDVVRSGLHKKLKTSRRKFFVLRAETPDTSARLEYYDTEKKYNSGQAPKRSIPLKTCFNINKRNDIKHKHVIALYTKDDCFCIVFENEEELDSWLKALLSLQHGEEAVDGETPRPTFEHVWQVTVLNRGLGTSGIIGNYRLCLTDKTLSLIKKDAKESIIELNQTSIRSCGSLKNYFFLEIGRSSTLGAGELWMDTEDSNIAQNIHSTVFHAMSTNSNKDDLGPKGRNRSSSATESSKPNASYRKQTTTTGAQKSYNATQDVSQTHEPSSTSSIVPPIVSSSSSQHPIVSGVASIYHHLMQRGAFKTSERRHSISAGGLNWSGNICHQRTQSLPLANPAPLTDHTTTNTSTTTTTTITTTLHPLRVSKRSNQSPKCVVGARERCDSMPSRARTTSENNYLNPWHRFYFGHNRSYGNSRDISHSPPSSSPVSPPSVGCSTDSTGSSYSLPDETDAGLLDMDNTLRYSIPTPDEVIAEEDYYHNYSYIPMVPNQSSDDGYVDMSPRGRHNTDSPTASMSSVTSGTPSTDIRFSDYPLDKVISYLPSEDSEDARPIRAYSVGSRPEMYRSKKCVEVSSCLDNARVRASSVGSKNKKVPGRILAPSNHHQHSGTKSSSAPILSNFRIHSNSHGSIGHMEDLMEMDFSRSNNNSTNASRSSKTRNEPPSRLTTSSVSTTTPSGYVEMRPCGTSTDNINQKPEVSPYVDMTSGSSPSKNNYMPQECETFVDLSLQYQRMAMEQNRNDYMEMDPKKNRYVKPSSSPNNSGISHCACTSNSSSVATTSVAGGGHHHYHSDSINKTTDWFGSFREPQINPCLANKPETNSSISKVATSTTPEGYVEMTLGKKHQRQSSYESDSIVRGINATGNNNDDYTNMTIGLMAKKNTVPTNNRRDKTRSQPITIQSTNTNSTTGATPKNSSSPISTITAAIFGRKHSSGTPPRTLNLPLINYAPPSYSSLPRRSRKNSRRDSKDSSSSSVTTPSSSSTIFPISLNSPSSPVKPPTVAATTPSTSYNNNFNTSTSSGSSELSSSAGSSCGPLKIPLAVLNTIYKSSTKSSEDYTVMDFTSNRGNNQKDTSEYVNYNPADSKSPKKPAYTHNVEDSSGDYAIMKPGKTVTNTWTTESSSCFRPIKDQPMAPLATVEPFLEQSSSSGDEPAYETLRTSPAKTNRPSSVTSESTVARPLLSRPSSVSSDSNRPGSASSELCSSSSTLVGSRPESVNSDRIRPASVSSDMQLHYASLDLDDGDRSPRTVKTSPTSQTPAISCGRAATSTTAPVEESAFRYAEIDFAKCNTSGGAGNSANPSGGTKKLNTNMC